MANKFAKNDEAVSAVIGVILMVAITVILAAVIAAFVFGMGSSIHKTYTVAFTIDRTSSGTVVVTNAGGQDVANLATDGITISYLSASGQTSVGTGTTNGITSALMANVGSSYTLTNPASPCHVVVTAKFKDGSSQVVATADV